MEGATLRYPQTPYAAEQPADLRLVVVELLGQRKGEIDEALNCE